LNRCLSVWGARTTAFCTPLRLIAAMAVRKAARRELSCWGLFADHSVAREVRSALDGRSAG
jgi:hypothetical protein